jgi:hypothetical protein
MTDWVEQCLHRMIVSISEMHHITDPEDLSDLMDILEKGIYAVICCNTLPESYHVLQW